MKIQICLTEILVLAVSVALASCNKVETESCEGCLITGTCYPGGVTNPLNPCEICDSDMSDDGWSPNNGAACDDGIFCNGPDSCSGGTCSQHEGYDCDDGVACNGIESCNEDTDRCEPGMPECAAGMRCDVLDDICSPSCDGCLISSSCFPNGAVNPLNPCEVCDSDILLDGWSPNNGSACDDGVFCNGPDSCSGGTCSQHEGYNCDDGVACNGVESCNETNDRCEPGILDCGAGLSCNIVDDTCSPTCSGCLISGTCYPDGLANPLNPCEGCDPDVSDDAWSPNNGAVCDDGIFCNGPDFCEAGGCTVHSGITCDDGVACNGVETCDSVLDQCIAGSSACAAGETCSIASDLCYANQVYGPTNLDFEFGGLYYLTTGAAAFPYSDANLDCIQGDSCAFLTNCSVDEEPGLLIKCGPVASNSVAQEEVESFCGMAPGELTGLVEGSAILRGMSIMETNTRVRINYKFLTSDVVNNDVFFIHHATFAPWTSHETIFFPSFDQTYVAHAGPNFLLNTSWMQHEVCIPEMTPYVRLCLGVMDAGDRRNSTAILLDDLSLVGGGANGCPGWTYAHDDWLIDGDVSLGTSSNILKDYLLVNDSDISMSIISADNVVCSGSGTPSVSVAVDDIVFTANGGVNVGDVCQFDYTAQGTTSPYDPTPMSSRATVHGITIVP